MKTITVSAYQRPDCLAKALIALAKCDGIQEYSVVGFVDYGPLQKDCLHELSAMGVASFAASYRWGCDRMIFECLRYGAFHTNSDFHIHVEDDIVLAPGALRWFEWAAREYRNDPTVMTVGAWAHVPAGKPNECRREVYFNPWGWGTWKDRLQAMLADWPFDRPGGTWDTHVMGTMLQRRHRVVPLISRAQNIGFDRAAHVPSPKFHAQYHHAQGVCEDVLTEFVEIK